MPPGSPAAACFPGREFVPAVSPLRPSPWRTSGLPSSSEDPTTDMPCSSTPLSFPRDRPVRASLLPSARTHGVGFLSTCRVSGLRHTACLLAVYASPRRSPFAVQHSLSAGGHLAEQVLDLLDPLRKVSASIYLISASPFPRLTLALASSPAGHTGVSPVSSSQRPAASPRHRPTSGPPQFPRISTLR